MLDSALLLSDSQDMFIKIVLDPTLARVNFLRNVMCHQTRVISRGSREQNINSPWAKVVEDPPQKATENRGKLSPTISPTSTLTMRYETGAKRPRSRVGKIRFGAHMEICS